MCLIRAHANTRTRTRTCIHVHVYAIYAGWMIRTSHDWAKYGDTNVCAVDWHALSAHFYSVAARRTKYVGKVVGKFLIRMIEFGMPVDAITVAGHSMGAHIAGFAGSYMKKRNLYLNELYGKCHSLYSSNSNRVLVNFVCDERCKFFLIKKKYSP